jgi:hypothetical protein
MSETSTIDTKRDKKKDKKDKEKDKDKEELSLTKKKMKVLK